MVNSDKLKSCLEPPKQSSDYGEPVLYNNSLGNHEARVRRFYEQMRQADEDTLLKWNKMTTAGMQNYHKIPSGDEQNMLRGKQWGMEQEKPGLFEDNPTACRTILKWCLLAWVMLLAIVGFGWMCVDLLSVQFTGL